MPQPTLDQIIEHLSERSAAGKVARLSPRTAALIEDALRRYADIQRTPEELTFRIDRWDKDGTMMEPLALVSDLTVAHGAFRAFCLFYPFECITLRNGALVLMKQEWSDRFALDSETRKKVAMWRARHRPVGGWRDGYDDGAPGTEFAEIAPRLSLPQLDDAP